MNTKYLSSLLTLGIVAVGSAPALASSDIASSLSFSCQVRDGNLMTIAEGEAGQQPVFHWNKASLPEGVNPEAVCQDIALKLNDYAITSNDITNLGFIGQEISSIPTICASENVKSGECGVVLMTLEPAEKPLEVAELFLNEVMDDTLKADKVQIGGSRGFQAVNHSYYPAKPGMWRRIFGLKLLK